MHRSLSTIIVSFTTVFALVGCSAAPDDDESDGDEAIEGETGIIEDGVAANGCNRHEAIFPQTLDRDRWVIDRALKWVDAHVMYSQTHTRNGWRQDCSGFVSMSWKLEGTQPGLVTGTMGARSHGIDWHDLRPGDALNKPDHHVMLFAGWANKAHTEFCALEEYATGHPASITRRSRADANAIGYHPIRRDHISP
jgi:hypothetical protein